MTRQRYRRLILVVTLTVLSLTAAACGGSQLSPATVRAANQAMQGQAGGSAGTGTVPGTGTTPGSSSGPGTGATGTGATGGTTGSGAGAGSGSTGSSSGSTGAAGVNAATGAGHHASCKGFHNSTGITDKTITVANASDISGPVPGIFTSAQQAAKAYIAYFNATSSICGRKLQLLGLDTRTDAGANQQAYEKACHQTFAAVGSMSAYDSGGASTTQACGLPDIRAMAISDARNACSTCFGAQATELNSFENAVPDFFRKHNHAATQRAAELYVNAAASVENAKNQQKVEQMRGMHFVYSASFDVAEFNYGSYVQAMKDKGVRWVQFVGSTDEAVRFAQAMQSANFHPDVFLLDPTSYNPQFVKTGGSAVDGAYVFIDFTPFEEASHNKELQLYEQWLQQVAPGSSPTYFGLFAWSATRLFVQQAVALGGKLTRSALVDRIRHVNSWTSNGLHAPQPVGSKHTSSCWRFIRLQHGRWVPVGGTRYLCHGVTRIG
ncbi:MAG: ABC transporter substrate-binding protein [Marmoricola sp.]